MFVGIHPLRRGTDLVLWIPVARSSPPTRLDDLNAARDASVLPGRAVFTDGAGLNADAFGLINRAF